MSADDVSMGRLLERVEQTGAAVDALSERQHDDSGRLTRVESSVAALREPLQEQARATRELTTAVDRLRVETVRDVSALRGDVTHAEETARRAHSRIDSAETRLAAVEREVAAIEHRREGVVRLTSGARGLLQGAAAGATAAAAIVGGVLWALARV